jgi:hypothetical protein
LAQRTLPGRAGCVSQKARTQAETFLGFFVLQLQELRIIIILKIPNLSYISQLIPSPLKGVWRWLSLFGKRP